MSSEGSSAKVGFFLKTLAGIERGTNALYALHGAIWLGLLRRAELNHVNERSYAADRSHTDEIYNRSGLDAWERAAMAQYFGSCRSFLVGGAGGGREVIALCRQDLRADGFECNPSLVQLAQRLLRDEGLNARILACAADEVPTDLGVYEAGIVGFGVYMHLVGRGNRVRFLKEFARHLAPGAPLLASFATRGEGRQDRYVAAIARAIQRLRGVEEEVQIGDALGQRFTHQFTEREIAAEFLEAGFELLCF